MLYHSIFIPPQRVMKTSFQIALPKFEYSSGSVSQKSILYARRRRRRRTDCRWCVATLREISVRERERDPTWGCPWQCGAVCTQRKLNYSTFTRCVDVSHFWINNETGSGRRGSVWDFNLTIRMTTAACALIARVVNFGFPWTFGGKFGLNGVVWTNFMPTTSDDNFEKVKSYKFMIIKGRGLIKYTGDNIFLK